MGLLRPAVQLEVPAVSGHDVHQAVFRMGDPARLTDADHVTLIAAASDAIDGAVVGPERFELCALSVAKRASRVEAARSCFTALHVVEGTLRLQSRDGSIDLGPRDTALLAPGTAYSLHATDAHDVTLLDLQYSPPPGTKPTDRNLNVSVARVDNMVPVRKRFPVALAPAINDILSPHTLHPVIGPVGRGPGRFEIVGPDELVVALATTPRGTGPALHVHRYSTEMFVVLEGQFRVYWGERGEHETLLNPLDAVVIPRGVNRAFEASGAGNNWILPMVVGTNDESEDIVFFPEVEQRIREAGPKLFAALATATRIRIGKRVGEVR